MACSASPLTYFSQRTKTPLEDIDNYEPVKSAVNYTLHYQPSIRGRHTP